MNFRLFGIIIAVAAALTFGCGGSSPKKLTKEGDAAVARGDNKAAIEFYKKALELDPNFAKANYELGCVLQDEKDAKAAVGYLEKAAAAEPDKAKYVYRYGDALLDAGEFQKAIGALEKSLQLSEDKGRAYAKLARAYTALNQPEKAKQIAEQGLKKIAKDDKFHKELMKAAEQ